MAPDREDEERPPIKITDKRSEVRRRRIHPGR